jgi:alpha-tubulin suppressor-like RCC1 family protein
VRIQCRNVLLQFGQVVDEWLASTTVLLRTPFRNPDLLEPHLLRSLLNVKAVSAFTSCSGCHFVVLDVDGNAWLFGRNGFACLGVPGVEFVSENAPHFVKPVDLGAPKDTKFVHAACGRNHTILVGSDGSVWAAGQNNLGQVC